jgi:predicted amidohydrolase YtcJ
VTINSAIQSHEQDTKGSITVGKKADFVILSRDPLHGNTKHFKDLQVLATIKEDKLVFGEY